MSFHKYVNRVMVNGKWHYIYPEDITKKKLSNADKAALESLRNKQNVVADNQKKVPEVAQQETTSKKKTGGRKSKTASSKADTVPKGHTGSAGGGGSKSSANAGRWVKNKDRGMDSKTATSPNTKTTFSDTKITSQKLKTGSKDNEKAASDVIKGNMMLDKRAKEIREHNKKKRHTIHKINRGKDWVKNR